MLPDDPDAVTRQIAIREGELVFNVYSRMYQHRPVLIPIELCISLNARCLCDSYLDAERKIKVCQQKHTTAGIRQWSPT
jgi:hypothetical protein